MKSSPSAIRARRGRSRSRGRARARRRGRTPACRRTATIVGRDRGDDDDRHERLRVDLGQHGTAQPYPAARRYPRPDGVPSVDEAWSSRCSVSSLTAPASAGAPVARADGPPSRRSVRPDPLRLARKHQMAAYSNRHYGEREWRLENPQAIVLHYTAGSTYASACNTFASNAPSTRRAPRRLRPVRRRQGRHDLPAHPPRRCAAATRSASTTSPSGSRWSRRTWGTPTDQPGDPRPQGAGARRGPARGLAPRRVTRIGSRDLIGHAMANDSRLFKDRKGWRNDHTDWPKAETSTFRKRVIRVAPRSQALSERARSRLRVPFGHSERAGAWSPDGSATPAPAHRSDRRRDPRRRGGRPRGGPAAATPSRPRCAPSTPGPCLDQPRRPRRRHAAPTERRRSEPQLPRRLVGQASRPRSGYYPGPTPFTRASRRALRRLVRRIDPDVTIHYHQPWGAVLAPCRGPDRRHSASTRGSPGLEVDRCRGQRLPGTATRWQNRRGGAAFVVELPESGLSDADVRRHARAAAQAAAGSGRPVAQIAAVTPPQIVTDGPSGEGWQSASRCTRPRTSNAPTASRQRLHLTEPRRSFGPVLIAIIVAVVFQLASPDTDLARFIGVAIRAP